ncbi:MAG TPA: polyphosphate kinase 2 family protein, partial [Blastocatellia bacterium]|nr:polyphosphate kinase 2 family protein [Blastocatellia bacterium]
KFSLNDVQERRFWNDYMAAYQDMLNHTSTEVAPWYIIPADNKWFMRTAVADVIITKLESMNLSYPTVSEEHRQNLLKAKELLEQEQE